MTGTKRHAPLLGVAVSLFRILGWTIAIRASKVVSFGTSAFGILQCHLPVVVTGRVQNDSKSKFRRRNNIAFHEMSSTFRLRNSQRYQSSGDDNDDNVGNSVSSSDTTPKFWRTTPGGLKIVDDTIGNGEEWSSEEMEDGTVARVRCQTQILQSSSMDGQRERVVFLEPSTNKDGSVVLSKDASSVTLIVVGNSENTAADDTTTNDTTSSLQYSGLRESLIGMRVGGRRRVLIPNTAENNAFNVRFVGPGAAAVTKETIVMNLELESLESPSSWNAIFATTLTTNPILLLVRPFWSPLGLLSLIGFAPLVIKKTINGFAALELYMDVNADAIYPIKTLLEWKLKF